MSSQLSWLGLRFVRMYLVLCPWPTNGGIQLRGAILGHSRNHDIRDKGLLLSALPVGEWLPECVCSIRLRAFPLTNQ